MFFIIIIVCLCAWIGQATPDQPQTESSHKSSVIIDKIIAHFHCIFCILASIDTLYSGGEREVEGAVAWPIKYLLDLQEMHKYRMTYWKMVLYFPLVNGNSMYKI